MQKAITSELIPTEIGTPFEGGFFAGLYKQGNETRALIISGKEGNVTGEWGEYDREVTGTVSYTDGLANTKAMAEAGSELAAAVLALRINGYDDWAIPARDQLEMLYRNFKPTTRENCCSFRDGDNPSSAPVGYPYTEQSPVQTEVESFREGGEHAIPARWLWSSTQYSSHYAWGQLFLNGGQYSLDKGSHYCARAVRSVVVAN